MLISPACFRDGIVVPAAPICRLDDGALRVEADDEADDETEAETDACGDDVPGHVGGNCDEDAMIAFS